jgi:hypothetical protein
MKLYRIMECRMQCFTTREKTLKKEFKWGEGGRQSLQYIPVCNVLEF